MSDGTLQTLDISMLEDVGTGAGKLIQLDSNAKIPACSAAALTGISAVTKSASDPTITTNLSVAAVWQNTTSGEMYVCTDATAGANVWTNIGDGTGNIEPWAFQGETYGYTAGGHPPYSDTIDKFSFASGTQNATDTGNLIKVEAWGAGHSGNLYGYACGGDEGSDSNDIQRHAYATDGNMTDVADLIRDDWNFASSNSKVSHGYVTGGANSPGGWISTIQRWPEATNSNATDVGNMTAARYGWGGQSSATHGYACGGENSTFSPTLIDTIDKFQFANESATAVDVGNLTNISYAAGQSSTTHGYASRGGGSSNFQFIDKFSFSTDGNASDIGNLTQRSFWMVGTSSRTYGYNAGYRPTSNVIEKFSFSIDGNSVDVGDLSQARGAAAGYHV